MKIHTLTRGNVPHLNPGSEYLILTDKFSAKDYSFFVERLRQARTQLRNPADVRWPTPHLSGVGLSLTQEADSRGKIFKLVLEGRSPGEPTIEVVEPLVDAAFMIDTQQNLADSLSHVVAMKLIERWLDLANRPVWSCDQGYREFRFRYLPELAKNLMAIDGMTVNGDFSVGLTNSNYGPNALSIADGIDIFVIEGAMPVVSELVPILVELNCRAGINAHRFTFSTHFTSVSISASSNLSESSIPPEAVSRLRNLGTEIKPCPHATLIDKTKERILPVVLERIDREDLSLGRDELCEAIRPVISHILAELEIGLDRRAKFALEKLTVDSLLDPSPVPVGLARGFGKPVIFIDRSVEAFVAIFNFDTEPLTEHYNLVANPKDIDGIKIRANVEARDIPFLLHFTRAENLPSIMTEGICSILSLQRLQVSYLTNDKLRLDGHRDASCLSIGHPNDKMFAKYRWEDPDQDWAVLVLDRSILWENNVAFCRRNAASKIMSCQALGELASAEAFDGMFEPAEGLPSREADCLMSFDPTDVQAEVLVFDTLPPRLIQGVVFSSARARRDYGSFVPELPISLQTEGHGFLGARAFARKAGWIYVG